MVWIIPLKSLMAFQLLSVALQIMDDVQKVRRGEAHSPGLLDTGQQAQAIPQIQWLDKPQANLGILVLTA